jgi:WD40 repeat protein
MTVEGANISTPADGGRAGYSYDCFASYNTAADYGLVRNLESFLESFHRLRTPEAIKLHKLEICVDGSDFSLARLRREAKEKAAASPGSLQDETKKLIAERLALCRYLVVFCPGKELLGPWSDWELEWFLANRRVDDVFLAVTHGSAPWERPEDFFPARILESGLHRKIWYDLRGYQGKRARSWQKVRNFEDEQTRLAADLNGVRAGEILPLWYRQLRSRYRRYLFIAIVVAVAIAGLLVLSLFLGEQSEERRLEAERETRVASARALAARSVSSIPHLPQLSLLLAVEAIDVAKKSGEPVEPEARQAIRDGLAKTGGQVIRRGGPRVLAINFSADSRRLATYSANEIVEVWDLEKRDSTPVGSIVPYRRDNPPQMAISGDALRIAIDALDLSASRQFASVREPSGKVIELTLERPRTDSRGVSYSSRWNTPPAITPGGRWKASSVYGGLQAVLVWDLDRPKDLPVRLEWPDGYGGSVALSADGRYVAVLGGGGDGRIWDMETKIPTRIDLMKTSLSHYTAIALANEGRRLATGGSDGDVKLWDLGDRSNSPTIFHGHEASIERVALSPDGRRIASVDSVGSVRLWHVNQPTLQPLAVRAHLGGVSAMVLGADGRGVISSGEDGLVSLSTFGDSDATSTVILGPDRSPRDEILDLVFPLLRKFGRAIWPPKTAARAGWLAISPRLKWAFAASISGPDIWAWDLSSAEFEPISVTPPGSRSTLSFLEISPDGNRMVTAGRGGPVHVWDLSRRPLTPTLLVGPDLGNFHAAIGSDNRRLVVASANGGIRIFDLDNPSKQPVVVPAPSGELHDDVSLRTTISPRGRWRLCLFKDGSARLDDLSDLDAPPRMLPKLLARGAGSFLNESRLLITSVDETLRQIWDFDQPSSTPFSLIHSGDIDPAVSTDDGRWLAAGQRGSVLVWELSGRATEPIILPAEPGRVQCLVISADGRWLFAGSDDGMIRCWHLELAELVDLARATAGRTLTPSEKAEFVPPTAALTSAPGLLGRVTKFWRQIRHGL